VLANQLYGVKGHDPMILGFCCREFIAARARFLRHRFLPPRNSRRSPRGLALR